jgi:hypothetical protein
VVVASLESKITFAVVAGNNAMPKFVDCELSQPCTSGVISVTSHWFPTDAVMLGGVPPHVVDGTLLCERPLSVHDEVTVQILITPPVFTVRAKPAR